MPRFAKCATDGCRNYIHRDGYCGPCWHYGEAAAALHDAAMAGSDYAMMWLMERGMWPRKQEQATPDIVRD